MDELDTISSHQDYLNDARSVVRDLINEALSGQKFRLMLYMVGVADDVKSFIEDDKALFDRISDSIINLVAYRREECEQIRAKIETLFEAAYSGCKDFDKAWKEIKDIQLEPAQDYSSLREFCKKFSGKLIEIHENYFHSFDKSFNKFEGKARKLVEAQARNKWGEHLGDNPIEETHSTEQKQGYRGHTKWKKYKGRSGFFLLVSKTTTIIRGIKDHAVDCYAELWHNGHQVAKAYGEAKNYPLTKEHIDTFYQWLTEFNYEASPTDGNPPDLAFIVSPFATDLQKRKLKIKSIEFIETERIDDISSESQKEGASINKADRDNLEAVLKDARFQPKTIDRLIENRPYESLEDIVSKTGFGSSIRKKLKDKIESGNIYFD
jgi:hypothetical protein